MPTTSNFGWTTPADTDLVKDGAAAIRTLGNGIDTSLVDLKGGTTGQILSKASNTDLDYTWITNDVGDITEVQAGTGITVTSGTGPIPTVALTTPVSVANGGTGITSFGTGIATFLGTPSSANLAAALTDETGTGAAVFASSPTLVTPNLGTPSAATLTNATGLPITAGTTGTLGETRGGTAQTTYTTGDLLYASAANTLAKRAIGTTGQVLTVSGGVPTWTTVASGSTFAGCSLTRSTSLSVANNSEAAVGFDTESFDSDGYHSTSTNTSRITIPSGKAGKYLFAMTMCWTTSSVGERRLQLKKNGAAHKYLWQMGGISGGYVFNPAAVIVDAAVGDYFEMFVFQTSGGNLTLVEGFDYTTFSCTYLGA